MRWIKDVFLVEYWGATDECTQFSTEPLRITLHLLMHLLVNRDKTSSNQKAFGFVSWLQSNLDVVYLILIWGVFTLVTATAFSVVDSNFVWQHRRMVWTIFWHPPNGRQGKFWRWCRLGQNGWNANVTHVAQVSHRGTVARLRRQAAGRTRNGTHPLKTWLLATEALSCGVASEMIGLKNKFKPNGNEMRSLVHLCLFRGSQLGPVFHWRLVSAAFQFLWSLNGRRISASQFANSKIQKTSLNTLYKETAETYFVILILTCGFWMINGHWWKVLFALKLVSACDKWFGRSALVVFLFRNWFCVNDSFILYPNSTLLSPFCCPWMGFSWFAAHSYQVQISIQWMAGELANSTPK